MTIPAPPEPPYRGLFRILAVGIAVASALVAIANLRGLWLTALIVVALLLESRIHSLWRSSGRVDVRRWLQDSRLRILIGLCAAVLGIGLAAIVAAPGITNRGLGSAVARLGRIVPDAAETRPASVLPRPADATQTIHLFMAAQRAGEKSQWRKEVHGRPGDVIQWLITTQNVKHRTISEVGARVVLGPHLEVVPESERLINADRSDFNQADHAADLFENGFGLGTYPYRGVRYIQFDTRLTDDFEGCSIRVRTYSLYAGTGGIKRAGATRANSADVIIAKTNCP